MGSSSSAPAAELLGRFTSERPPTNSAGAAVTIVLREGTSDVEVLLIERAEDPNDPASGQVALPGGHVSETDGNLQRTALRELEEEVGLVRGDLDGEPRFVTIVHAQRFRLDVGIFAAALGPEAQRPSVRSPAEVAHVFWMPRHALDVTRSVERATYVGARTVPATVHEGHVLWGFTRRVLRDFFGYPVEEEAGPPVYGVRRPSETGVSSRDS